MSQKRTFVDNWYANKNEIFQLLISDEINHLFGKEPPLNTIIERENISDTESLYYISGEPIMKIVCDISKSKETIYVRDRRRAKRRSQTSSPTISLPVARVKTGKI